MSGQTKTGRAGSPALTASTHGAGSQPVMANRMAGLVIGQLNLPFEGRSKVVSASEALSGGGNRRHKVSFRTYCATTPSGAAAMSKAAAISALV